MPAALGIDALEVNVLSLKLPKSAGVVSPMAAGARRPHGDDKMADQNLDARRVAREQQQRITAAACIGLNALKPVLEFQISMLRLWADNAESAARNYEEGIETFSEAVEQQSQQRAA